VLRATHRALYTIATPMRKKNRKPESVRNLFALMESNTSETRIVGFKHKLSNVHRIGPAIDGGLAEF